MSAKSVAEKMYIKPGMRIGFFNAPDNIMDLLGGLPEEVEIIEELPGKNLDLVIGFIEDIKMLEGYLGALKNAINDKGALWLAYPKKSSGKNSDIDRESIHEYVIKRNMKGEAMISINDQWSAFRCRKI